VKKGPIKERKFGALERFYTVGIARNTRFAGTARIAITVTKG